MAEILLLSATIGDPDVARKVMPWEMADAQRRADASKPSQLEIDLATAELDEEIIFKTE